MNTLLVVGARGLGAEIADYFARKHWRVICAARSADTVDGLAKRVTAIGGDGVPLVCDVTQPDTLSSLLGEQIDLAVLAQTTGGRFGAKPFLEIDRDELDRSFQAMVGGTWNLLKAIGPQFVANKRGTVVQIGTSSALRSKQGFAANGAVHAGLRNLIQVVAKEWRTHGVHVAYLPVDAQIESEGAREWLQKHGLEKSVPPSEIARACEFLHEQPARAFTHELVIRPSATDWTAPT